MGEERRKAARLRVEIPTVVEAIAANPQELPESLRAVYERVEPASDYLGKPSMYTVRDVSTNGAFLEGPPLSLMSRIRFRLPFGDRADLEAIGWVLWRRNAPCVLESPRSGEIRLEPGIGILFEAIPLDVRIEIARLALAGG